MLDWKKYVIFAFQNLISMKTQMIPNEITNLIPDINSVKCDSDEYIPEGYVSFEEFADNFDRKLRERYAQL